MGSPFIRRRKGVWGVFCEDISSCSLILIHQTLCRWFGHGLKYASGLDIIAKNFAHVFILRINFVIFHHLRYNKRVLC